MKVQKGKIVRLSYRVTTADGHIVDQALSDDPLVVVQGSGQLSEPVEERIEGLSPGDAVAFELRGRSRADGASHRPFTVTRDQLPKTFVPRIGAAVGSGDPPNEQIFWVREVRNDHVVLDPHDPLAKALLKVRVWILDVEKPQA